LTVLAKFDISLILKLFMICSICPVLYPYNILPLYMFASESETLIRYLQIPY
jgi:hypothetical protein